MKNRDGALSFDAYIADTQFHRQIARMERGIEGLSRKASKEANDMDQVFTRLGQRAAGVFAGLQLAQLPAQITRVRGEFQQLEIAFTTMLGSKERADQLMKDVVQFAAQTPYGLKQTSEATKMLIAYGIKAEDTIGTLRRLGDIAAGVGAPLKDIAYLYGTTATQGRMYGADLNQFLNRGIPLTKALASAMGVAESNIKKMVEEGKIGFPELQRAVVELTKEGSMFGGLMAEQAKSIVGLQAELGDAIENMLNEWGRSNEGVINMVLRGGIAAVENYEKIIDVLKVVIATYGAYRAALLLTAAAQASAGIAAAAMNWLSYARSVRTATDAMTLFNLVVRANPFVLAATALTALVGAFVYFNREAGRAVTVHGNITKAVDDEKASSEMLVKQINDESLSREFRNKKLKELIDLSPDVLKGLTLEKIATEEGKKAIDEYIKSKARKIEMDQLDIELAASAARLRAAERGENELTFLEKMGAAMRSAGNPYDPNGGMNYMNRVKDETIAKNEQIIKQETELSKSLSDRYRKLVEEGTAAGDFATLPPTTPTGGSSKGKKNEVGPFGSISFWENEIKKAQEAVDKLPGFQTEALAKQAVIIKFATEEIEAIRKSIAIKSIDEELEEKRKKYELYERWVVSVGQKVANEQFAALIEGGKSYRDFLAAELAKGSSDPKIIEALTTELARVEKVPTSLESYKKKLDEIGDTSATVTDEIIALEEAKAALDKRDRSTEGIEKAIEVQNRLNAAYKARRQMLAEFLTNAEGSEEKLAEIQKHYSNLRAALDEANSDKKSKAYLSALAKIRAAEKKEMTAFNAEKTKLSARYKELNRIIELATNEQTQQVVDANRELLMKALKDHGEYSDEYIAQLQKVRAAEDAHRQRSVQNWQAIGSAIEQLGGVISQMQGSESGLGGLLAGLGSGVGAVASALAQFKKNQDGGGSGVTAGSYIQAATGAIQLIGMLTAASKERKRAEEEFYLSSIRYQNEYNRALNAQIGIQYQKNSSVFLDDITGKLVDGSKQLTDAQIQYEASMQKLVAGRVKVGQKNGIDWGAVGKGAAAGAAGGSAFGPWGTVIGGVVGAVAGLFSKKKKDIYGGLLEVFPELITQTGEFNAVLAQNLIANGKVDEQTKLLLEDTIAWAAVVEQSRDQILSVISDLAGAMGNDIQSALVNAFKAGEDAAGAFGKAVGKTIENIVAQILFSKLFADDFKNLEEEMTASYGAGGDMNFVDDIMRFYEAAGPKAMDFVEGLAAAQEEGKRRGLSLWEKEDSGSGSSSPSGTIRGMTEETASQLVGQFNAIRIYQAEMTLNTRTMIVHLAAIAYNTSYNRNLTRLEGMERALDELVTAQKSGRGWGQ